MLLEALMATPSIGFECYPRPISKASSSSCNWFVKPWTVIRSRWNWPPSSRPLNKIFVVSRRSGNSRPAEAGRLMAKIG